MNISLKLEERHFAGFAVTGTISSISSQELSLQITLVIRAHLKQKLLFLLCENLPLILCGRPVRQLTMFPSSEPREAEALRITLTISPKSPSSWFGVAATSQIALRKKKKYLVESGSPIVHRPTFGGSCDQNRPRAAEQCAWQALRRGSPGARGSGPRTAD